MGVLIAFVHKKKKRKTIQISTNIRNKSFKSDCDIFDTVSSNNSMFYEPEVIQKQKELLFSLKQQELLTCVPENMSVQVLNYLLVNVHFFQDTLYVVRKNKNYYVVKNAGFQRHNKIISISFKVLIDCYQNGSAAVNNCGFYKLNNIEQIFRIFVAVLKLFLQQTISSRVWKMNKLDLRNDNDIIQIYNEIFEIKL